MHEPAVLSFFFFVEKSDTDCKCGVPSPGDGYCFLCKRHPVDRLCLHASGHLHRCKSLSRPVTHLSSSIFHLSVAGDHTCSCAVHADPQHCGRAACGGAAGLVLFLLQRRRGGMMEVVFDGRADALTAHHRSSTLFG